jgi:uncharacterized membrane protein
VKNLAVNYENKEDETEESEGSNRLSMLLTAGFVLIFAGVAAVLVAGGNSGSVGGVIFIGPIPIVFGAGPDAGWLIFAGVVIAVLGMIMFYVFNKRSGR